MTAPLSHDWRLALAALCVAGGLAVVFVGFPGNNLLILAGLVAIPAFLITAGWHPELFLVGCAFMPQWKNAWPMDQFASVGDLTLVMLLGLVVGVFWRSLRHVGGLERDNFSQFFRGQWLVLSAYILFAAAVLASFAYTSAPNYGGVKLLRFLFIGSLFLFSGIVLVRDEMEFRRISLLFVLATGVTAVQMIFHLEHRVVGAETDITRIGAGWLLGMGVLLLVGYPNVRNARRNLILIVVALPVLSAGLIASAARGPMVSLAVALPLTLLWFSNQRFSAVRIWVAALLIGSCVVSYVYLRHVDPDKYRSKLSEMILLSRGESGSGSGAKRLGFYSRTLAAIPDNFWLGQGIGSWSVFYYGRDTRDYPHNLFLETTFEEGVVGEVLLLLFLCLLAMATRRMLKTTKLQYGVLAGLLIYCVSVSMFSGDLDDNRILWLWAGITMAICRNAYLENRRRSLLNRYSQNVECPVPAIRSTQSIFAHPQVLKG
jgi:O-antigen ligase